MIWTFVSVIGEDGVTDDAWADPAWDLNTRELRHKGTLYRTRQTSVTLRDGDRYVKLFEVPSTPAAVWADARPRDFVQPPGPQAEVTKLKTTVDVLSKRIAEQRRALARLEEQNKAERDRHEKTRTGLFEAERRLAKVREVAGSITLVPTPWDQVAQLRKQIANVLEAAGPKPLTLDQIMKETSELWSKKIAMTMTEVTKSAPWEIAKVKIPPAPPQPIQDCGCGLGDGCINGRF